MRAEQRLGERDAVAPDVRIGNIGLTLDTLGRHVGESAAPGHGGGERVLELAADAKVGDLDVSVGVKEQVGRLDIAMNDVKSFVQIVKTAHDATRNGGSGALVRQTVKRSATKHLQQRATITELKQNSNSTIAEKCVDDLNEFVAGRGGVAMKGTQFGSQLLRNVVCNIAFDQFECKLFVAWPIQHTVHSAEAAMTDHAQIIHIIRIQWC